MKSGILPSFVTVNEHRNVLTEKLLYLIERYIGVLNNIVEERRTDSIGVHSEFKQDISDRKRVGDIRLTRGTNLICVCLCRKFVGRYYLAEVVLLFLIKYLLDYHINGVYGFRLVISHKYDHSFPRSVYKRRK